MRSTNFRLDKHVCAALSSGAMLWLAFPPLAQEDAAWFGVVPLLISLRYTTPRRGFWLGWLAGLVFWLGNLGWLWRLVNNGGPAVLVIFGHAALAAYCAVYMALFASATAGLWQWCRARNNPWTRLLMAVVIVPALWIGSEHLRATVFTGFAWNALGVSQYRNLALIQAAAWGGTGAVSGILVAVNSAIAFLLERLWFDVFRKHHTPPADWTRERRFRLRTVELTVALAMCVAVWIIGIDRVRGLDRTTMRADRLRLALFHLESPSVFERDDQNLEELTVSLLNNSRIAAAANPDILVWPETILPGIPGFSQLTDDLIGEVTRDHLLLAGGIEARPQGGWELSGEYRYYNSAFLFSSNHLENSVYRKQHLVPFGEFIPLGRLFPKLDRLSPIGFTCTSGTNSVIMEVPSRSQVSGRLFKLSPLICFEDTMSYLSRNARKSGAQLLVNLTNDAWFKGSTQAEQHLAQAVFRCVETGLPMVRSSNSGVTAIIRPNGRVARRMGGGAVEDNGSGVIIDELGVSDEPVTTFYLTYGKLIDWLAVMALLLALGFGMVKFSKR